MTDEAIFFVPLMSFGGTSLFRGDGAGDLGEGEQRGSRYSHLDRLGTNARTTDTSANLIDSRSYDAFGLPQQINNPSNSEQGFASAHGYQEDAESGFNLLRQRVRQPGKRAAQRTRCGP